MQPTCLKGQSEGRAAVITKQNRLHSNVDKMLRKAFVKTVNFSTCGHEERDAELAAENTSTQVLQGAAIERERTAHKHVQHHA